MSFAHLSVPELQTMAMNCYAEIERLHDTIATINGVMRLISVFRFI